EYAGRPWQILSEVQASADPGLLRITVWVAAAEQRRNEAQLQERAVTRLDGFVGVAR
ncbi:type II secretion system protein, partial [Stutzerimonas nitrititolerans]